MNSNIINTKNPSFDYYLFQLFEYSAIVFFGSRIILLNKTSVFSIEYVAFLLTIYCLSCFWTKKMLLYNDKIEVVYPTRIISRCHSITHNAIQKVIFTDRTKAGRCFVIYIKESNRYYTVKSGTNNDIIKTIQYFRVKNIIFECDLTNIKDKKYIDEQTTE